MSTVTFSVVICVLNGADRIADTLHSLEDLDYPAAKYEVIVIDDGSTDATAELVRQTFPEARLIQHEKNLGHSAARNTGFQHAQGEYVAYIDDDCIADPRWLVELEKTLRQPDTLAAGGRIDATSLKYIAQRYLIRSGYGRPAPLQLGETKNIWQRFTAYVKDKFSQAAGSDMADGPVCEVYGANAAFPRAKLEAVEGFPTSIRTSEDAAICQRLRAAYPEQQIRFTGAAKVTHAFSPTFGTYLYEVFRRQADNLLYYRLLEKTPPIFPFPIAIFGAALASAFIAWWLPFAVLLTAPLLAYAWWMAAAVRRFRPEYLAYAYMQAIDETVRNIGLLTALVRRFSRPYPHVLFAVTLLTVALGAVHVLNIRYLQLPAAAAVIMVPGYLLLQALGLRRVLSPPLKRVAFMALLGVIWNMIIGLAAATILPLIHHKQPLAIEGLLPVYGIGIAVLAFAAIARRQVVLPRRSFQVGSLATLLWIITAALPFCAVIGANLLNRGDSNIASLITLGAAAALLAVTAWCSKRLPASLLPAVLFSVSLTVLLSYMMRSSYVFGWDIQQEYKMMMQTQASASWFIGHIHNPYDAMLSLTIFPTALASLSGLAPLAVFKVIFPVLFSFVPVLLYYLYRLWAKRWIAFVAAAVFISQFYYFQEFAALARQQLAFLFFAGLLYVLFQQKLRGWSRGAIGALLIGGVVVSHYSTTYLAIAILSGSFILAKLFNIVRRRHWLPVPAKTVPLWAVLGLIAGAVLWYGPATHSSQAFQHIDDIANGRANISSVSQTLQEKFHKDEDKPTRVSGGYLENIGKEYRADHPYLSYYPGADNKTIAPVKDRQIPDRLPLLRQASVVLDTLLRYAWWILGAAGILWFIRGAWKRFNYKDSEAAVLGLMALLAFVAIHIIPGIGAYYNIPRLNQQALMFVALPAIVVLSWLLGKYLPRFQKAGVVGIMMAAFLIASGLMSQAVGGQPHANLNNFGTDYRNFYIHPSEVAAARWLQQDRGEKQQVIYADRYANLRLVVPTDINGHVVQDITPETLATRAYVFAGYSNTVEHVSTAGYQGGVVSFQFPEAFIQTNKNKLYTNSYTGVYK